MPQRAGTADLPLHGGHFPKWLADRMTRLGAVMSEAIIHHSGTLIKLRESRPKAWPPHCGSEKRLTVLFVVPWWSKDTAAWIL